MSPVALRNIESSIYEIETLDIVIVTQCVWSWSYIAALYIYYASRQYVPQDKG